MILSPNLLLMKCEMKKIIDLSNIEAKNFLLKEESYFTFDLPIYFTFNKLLQDISRKLENSNLSDFYSTFTEGSNTKSNDPKDFEDVNYKLIHNKNGQYSWRLFQLIHPVIYVSLVHKITEENNWKVVVDKLKEYNENNFVECLSLPVVSEDEKSDKASQINVWLQEVEQQSIALSLDFEYLFHTDIVDCYGSIYSHSVSWAIHTKEESKKKENRNNKNLVGVVIDQHIQSMSNGQTNGIPQGSILMDFIAEIVLSYVDSELTKRIKDIKKIEYKILRYRDDYRIFVNNPQIGEEIIKNITNVLSEVGMKINSEKTSSSKNIIYNSIKEDKLFYIQNYKLSKNIQNELLIINDFADKYPNSGSLNKLLQNFFNRIESWKYTPQNIEVVIGILMNIAYKNPRIYPITSSILSKFLSFLTDNQRKEDILQKIIKRFKKIPNTEHLDLWLQRISLKLSNDITYSGNLCKKVIDDDTEIWNNDWLNQALSSLVNNSKIINKNEIENLDIVVKNKEVALFEKKTQYYH